MDVFFVFFSSPDSLKMAVGAGQVQWAHILLVPDLYVSGGEHQQLLHRLVIAPHGRVVEWGQAVSG